MTNCSLDGSGSRQEGGTADCHLNNPVVFYQTLTL